MIKNISLPYPEELSGGAKLDAATLASMRDKMKKMLADEEYGELPPLPDAISYEVASEEREFCAGKAT